MSHDILQTTSPQLGVDTMREMLVDRWGLDEPDVRVLASERDLIVRVADGWILKVSNPAEQREVLDMEIRALAHIRTADPGLVVPETLPSRDGALIETVTDELGRTCFVRLITVVPGAGLEGQPISSSTAEDLGEITARMTLALSGFFHAAGGRDLDWDVRSLPQAVRGEVSDERIIAVAARTAGAIAQVGALPGGIQHGDVTLTNILAQDGEVTGVIDFGDMHHTAAVCELAVTMTAVLRNTSDVVLASTWDLAAGVLRGYQRHRLLQPDEVDVLGELILARLALTLLISGRRADRHADNRTYIEQYDSATDRVLDELRALAPEDLARRLHVLAGTGRAPRGKGPASTDLPERRSAVMSSLSPLFYATPLHLIRGQGPWVYGADGRRYLDGYNNVAVVGHGHPAVTQAVTRQLAVFNSHSRYLHEGAVELAERVLATMPPELDTCLFTTSGTEANELAWRMATAVTGNDGAIIAQHAYHGASAWMAQLSSNEWPEGYRPDGVATFRAPHPGEGPLTDAEARRRMARAAAELRTAGREPALVLVDTQFTSEGVLDCPPEFFQGLVEGARTEGALFLADEVQAGFGRSGAQLWRFALAGITPDIVTLGKPMGAGYPIGAVVTRRGIADRLAKDYEYFSTFAATPVAAAAGNTVLDLLDAEGLAERATATGDYLRASLVALSERHDRLGSVRGIGLVAGVDLRAPDGQNAAFARRVLNDLVQRGVLVGLTGSRGDVLKVRPPLVWQNEHVDRFTRTLDDSLTRM